MNSDQLNLLRDLVSRRGPGSIFLVEQLVIGSISSEGREALCALVNDEFCYVGLDESFQPTKEGLMLEALLDEINRPRISL